MALRALESRGTGGGRRPDRAHRQQRAGARAVRGCLTPSPRCSPSLQGSLTPSLYSTTPRARKGPKREAPSRAPAGSSVSSCHEKCRYFECNSPRISPSTAVRRTGLPHTQILAGKLAAGRVGSRPGQREARSGGAAAGALRAVPATVSPVTVLVADLLRGGGP